MIVEELKKHPDEVDKERWNASVFVVRESADSGEIVLRVIRVWRAFLHYADMHKWENVSVLTASVVDQKGSLLVHTYKRWPKGLRMLLRRLWELAGEDRGAVYFFDSSVDANAMDAVDYGAKD